MRLPGRTSPVVAVSLALAAVCLGACGGGGSGPDRSGGRRFPDGGSAAAPLLTIAAVGDTFGMNVPPGDPLGPARDLLRDADLFVFNHEGVIRTTPGSCEGIPRQSVLVSGPDVAAFLAPARRNVATLANNHVFDCGERGIAETRAALADRGIDSTGTGAGDALLVRVGDRRVAVLARLAGLDVAGAAAWDADRDPALIADLAAGNDLVVVALHLHLVPSWTDETAAEHVAVVGAALDAGADLVIGHGSHAPQGVMVRGGGIGLLSLGNFLFRPDYEMPGKAHRSVVAEVAVHGDRTDLTLHPFRLDAAGRPGVPAPEDARKILRRIADLSRDLGTSLEIRDGAARLSAPR